MNNYEVKNQSISLNQSNNRFRIISLLNELHLKYKDLKEGKVADYIPELSKASKDWFGITIVTVNGEIYEVGDTNIDFTIQSISKAFSYGLALEDHGREGVLQKIGVEPTGDAFNNISLDEKTNRPYNPMINAGAIATTSLIKGSDPTDRLNRLLDTFKKYAGRKLHVDISVFMSERTTGHRNRALAHLMKNFNMIDGNIDEALDLYFQQCSLMVTGKDLAVMAATLANDGENPLTGERALDRRYIRDILSIMFTCGMYDYAGEWAYNVGLPAKSGVGGGILGVVPGQFGISVFSPPLDHRGNCIRGIKVFEDLSSIMGTHVFDAWMGVADKAFKSSDAEALENVRSNFDAARQISANAENTKETNTKKEVKETNYTSNGN